MPVADGAPVDPGTQSVLRSSADNPLEKAILFNTYFALVYTHDSSSDDNCSVLSDNPAVITELTLTVNEVKP